MNIHELRPPKGQRGAAILVTTILILLVATIGTLMVGRVGLMEQKVVGTDVRSKEVYSAAVGGLEFGKEWFQDNYASLDFGDGTAGSTASNSPAMEDTALNVDDYEHTLMFELVTDADPVDGSGDLLPSMPRIVRIISTATAAEESHVTKTVSIEVMLGSLQLFSETTSPGGDGEFEAPPIVMESCLTGTINGNPAISYDYDGSNPSIMDVAMATTQGLDSDGDGVNDLTLEDCMGQGDMEGHLGLCDIDSYPDSCPNNGDVDSGDALDNGVEFRTNLDEPASLWDTIFGANVEKGDLLELERRAWEELGTNNVYIVDSTYPHYSGQPSYGQQWHNDLGDANNDVILFFDEEIDCPKINGGTTIYGLVYYEKETCDNNGWGGGVIYGTFAKAGNLTRLNSNAVLIATGLDFGGGADAGGGSGDGSIDIPFSEVARYSEIPGSWRDY